LQGKTEIHLHDFVLDDSPVMNADLDASLAFDMAHLNANVAVRDSNPVNIVAAVPLKLEKRGTEFALSSNGPLSASVNFPALFLAKLPTFISHGLFTRGILSGNLNFSDSVQHPLITGSIDLTDGQLLRGLSISAGVTATGTDAAINFFHWNERDADISARGKIEFGSLSSYHLTLWPSVSLRPTMALREDDCVGAVTLYASPAVALLTSSVNQIDLRGSLFGRGWTISLSHEPADPDNNADFVPLQTFPLCREGKTLSLGLTPSLFP
jgi:autotransporter translocation and assembly factor TamB